jgi:hypothetical protein
MKLSSDTLNLLKNFASINQGIYFKQGKTVKTVSPQKNIMAEGIIDEEVPVDFGVYDLNNFLSVLSLHKDDPTLAFEDKNVLISGLKGRSKIKYRFCEPTMIVTPPEKNIVVPDPEIKFTMTAEDFDWVLRAAAVLSSPQIAVESDGKKIFISTIDIQNDSAHTDSIEIADGNGDKFRMIFKTENLKMIAGSYDVSISSKGVSHFKNQKMNLQYWITTEAGSKFEKGK